MPENNFDDAIKEIKKDIASLKELKEELSSIIPDSKESERIENRRFEIRKMELEHGDKIVSSIIAIMASIFVSLITTSITLLSTLSAYISIGLSATMIIEEIAVAFFTILVSWFIITQFRNKRIREIEKEFHLVLNPEKKT